MAVTSVQSNSHLDRLDDTTALSCSVPALQLRGSLCIYRIAYAYVAYAYEAYAHQPWMHYPSKSGGI